ncbi:alpha/beta fold hydrolase [Promicromonospora sukumoe]|uniref:alpha/beta fold hydrolase n=1 Tax=Promicromonospora sukumoe TaxID=88382 RepID=UPI00036A79E1|nr:alpha/beta hydrolase [Promicromonospora sukumoe]
MTSNDTARARLEGTVTSADGTTIAYERAGSGPVVVLVAQALADRKDNRGLARLLAASCTVVNYDRRGRGASTDAGDWSPQREIDDLDALISAHGGSAALVGASSGAVLALDAAAALPGAVTRVAAYEAPVIVDDRRPPVPRDLGDRLAELVRAGRAARAVSEFNRVALGAPAVMVAAMRLMLPAWRAMVAMAPTTVYDARLCVGLQDGTPLDAARWGTTSVPVLVMVGGKGEPFMRSGSEALAGALGARHAVVPGAHHGTPMMKPAALLPELEPFLQEGSVSGAAAPVPPG